ncbi:MAG TPA: aspartate aminotransferase family protein [Polyangiales bacterium]|nr:aspartate aminotransferase family protein [Polyangiales bacterium]
MDCLLRPYAVPGRSAPLTVSHGLDCSIIDGSGREYLDAASGLWNVSVGLGNEEVIARMTDQLRRLAYAGLFDYQHPAAIELASRLLGLAPPAFGYVYLSTSGTAAVEVALHVARLHWQARGQTRKRRVLSFDCGYHGCSLMNLSASGLVHHEIDAGEPALLPDFETIPSPADEAASLAGLESTLSQRGEEFACLLVEPVPASAGVLVASSAYWRQVNALCREYGVLLVADEVATGGGRCGAFLASVRLGLEPSIVALSKGINGGYYPLGATLFSRQVVAPIRAANLHLSFGSTQDGNPVGCAAALAVLDILERDALCQRANELGARLLTALGELAGTGMVRGVRGIGLMIAIDLQYEDGRPCDEAKAVELRLRCRDQGLLVYHYAGGLSLFPALTMSDDAAETAIAILRDVLTSAL